METFKKFCSQKSGSMKWFAIKLNTVERILSSARILLTGFVFNEEHGSKAC